MDQSKVMMIQKPIQIRSVQYFGRFILGEQISSDFDSSESISLQVGSRTPEAIGGGITQHLHLIRRPSM